MSKVKSLRWYRFKARIKRWFKNQRASANIYFAQTVVDLGICPNCGYYYRDPERHEDGDCIDNK